MKTTLKHKLVLLLDALIEIKSSEDWEDTTTPEQHEHLTAIIESLDQLWFTYRNQISIK